MNHELKSRLEDYIDEYDPKVLTRYVKKDSELDEAIQECEGRTYSEKMYNALTDHEHSICERGNLKKYVSITKGYKFCGPTGKCECARDQVSKKTSETKQSLSEESIKKSSEKRKSTMVDRYQVDNPGKLPKAKENRKAHYDAKRAAKGTTP